MVATPAAQAAATTTVPLVVTWELLPEDYVLPNDPVDNRTQPALAAALTDSLAAAGGISPQSMTLTNYAVCATVNDRLVVKAPDWGYVPTVRVPLAEVERSYTPQLQGDVPAVVMEFISHEEGTEYSIKPTYPPGKWFFYERILRVPCYVIFNPEVVTLEVYHLDAGGQYTVQSPDEHQRYLIPGVDRWLGIWQGAWEGREGVWLRWWDQGGEMLPLGTELAEQERQRAEQERQRAEEAEQRAKEAEQRAAAAADRAERLAAQLRAAGLDPEG